MGELSCLLFAAAWAALPYGAKAPLPPSSTGWREAGMGGIRGVTVGPIENALHPTSGYGTPAGQAALREAAAWGASWVALTPFGRVWNLDGQGIDLVFEAPLAKNTEDIARTVDAAHALGLRVMLVPHLWVESGQWRARINPKTDRGWQRWAAAYRAFLLHWARVAQASQVDMLSVGVELRSWVTTSRMNSFASIIDETRSVYAGLLTYSGNWDDIAYTMILDRIDVIGVNAFYPLADKNNASRKQLRKGGEKVRAQLQELASTWNKPVVLTEMGYTTRRDPALRPWEWPDGMSNVVIDQQAQADAYHGLLAPLLDQDWFAGFFLWRTYADPEDVSQEAEWGFSPRGKLAELTVRDAFSTRWACDGDPLVPNWMSTRPARRPGMSYGLHASIAEWLRLAPPSRTHRR